MLPKLQRVALMIIAAKNEKMKFGYVFERAKLSKFKSVGVREK